VSVRSDVTVDWQASPRIITVAAPSTTITIQDLVDTLRSLEDEIINMDNPHLVNASGKENLGGGVLVGITCSLQNAKLAFEARGGEPYTLCTVTGGNLVAVDTDGVTPIDAIQPTAFVTVNTQASSSGTLAQNDTIDTINDTVAAMSPLIEQMDAIAQNKMVTDPETGMMTIYDTDGTTILYQAQLYEDTEGTIPYSGRGVQRRERIS